MRPVLTNFGSTGSVYPYLALGVEFQRHGHSPVLALPPYFEKWARSLGLGFAAIGPDLRDIQNEINQAMVIVPDSATQFQSLLAPLAKALPLMYEHLRAICKGADVLISGPVQPAGLMIHETTGIPLVTVQNVHFTNGGSPAFQEALASMINPLREHLGLRTLHDPIQQANCADLVLFAMSRYVRPPQPHWPANYHMTGYFFLEEEWRPDSELAEFFASGERPIAVTFGSMTHGDREAFTDLIFEAIERAGCRAVVQQGWDQLADRNLPDNVRALGFVPHHWLFTNSALAVHHGGSGTTASAFRAGVPSVFVTHTWDQPVWADLARELGCSPHAIPLPELSARRLGDAISEALGNPAYHAAAAKLGDQIRREHGVRRARQLIEKLISKIGLAADAQESAGARTGP